MPPLKAVAALAVLSSSLLAHAAGEPSTPVYALPMPEAATGTSIVQRIAKNSAIPFNLRYSDLTPEQKQLVKSQYEAMAEADEPPFPTDGLRNIYGRISAAQSSLNVEGELSMFVEVNAAGKATAVSVLKSPSPELTRVAASILMFEPYKPAVCAGKPCAMAFPFRVNLVRR